MVGRWATQATHNAYKTEIPNLNGNCGNREMFSERFGKRSPRTSHETDDLQQQ